MRYATVEHSDRKYVEAYLPDNYEIVDSHDDLLVIGGEDHAGWTLDEYVIPRLASGGVYATELIETGEVVADKFRDDIRWVRNAGFVAFFGSLAKVVAVDESEVMVISKGSPRVNGVPVEFRTFTKFNSRGEMSTSIYAYRKDRGLADDVTGAARRKIREYVQGVAFSTPAKVLLAGQADYIEKTIKAKTAEIERVGAELGQLKEERRELEVQLGLYLTS